MIISRRNRKLAGFLIVVVLCIIVLILTESGQQIVDNYLKVDPLVTKIKLAPGQDPFLDKLRAVVAPLQKNDPVLQYVMDPLAGIQSKIKLPNYLVNKKEESPKIQTFDARFTLGLLLHHIRDQIKSSNPTDLSLNQDLKHPQEFNLQYFHWADWTDLSALDEFIFAESVPLCDDLFRVTPTRQDDDYKKPQDYCIHDDDIASKIKDKSTDDNLRTKLEAIQENSQRSQKFHILGYTGRTTQKNRILHGNAYLNEFMDPPQKIIILNQDPKKGNNLTSRAVVINVDQNPQNRERLINTPVVDQYVEDVRSDAAYDTTNDVYLDVWEEFTRFNEKLDKSSDEQLPDHRPINYNIELTHQMFEDETISRLNDLNARKGKNGALSLSDESYRQALEYSSSDAETFKYFYEAKLLRRERTWAFGAHYDWRFFDGLVNEEHKTRPLLFGLLRAWLQLTHTYQLKTWIAHGSLLSWYWNGVSFPWDFDIDVQMPLSDLHKISQMFNQSLIVDLGETGDGSSGNTMRFGRYFLDCGTFLSRRERGRGQNNIDARFIDIDTGAYIDITALALSNTRASERYGIKDLEKSGFDSEYERNRDGHLYNCRNNHFTSLSELSPLRLTFHDGIPGYIVNNYENVLVAEYRKKGIVEKIFKTKVFLQKLGLYGDIKKLQAWTKDNQPQVPIPIGSSKSGFRNYRNERNFDPFMKWTDDNWVEYLKTDQQLSIEYVLTHELTDFHKMELQLIEDKKLAKSMVVDDAGHLKVKLPEIRHDYWSYMQQKGKLTFEDKIAATSKYFGTSSIKAESDPEQSSIDRIIQAAKEINEEKKVAANR